MIGGRRVGIVLPAYNAAATLSDVVAGVPAGLADEVLLVDDASTDGTAEVARGLGIDVIEHPYNQGYGANQKTCYDVMLARGVDVIAMLHPDDQYPGALLPQLITPIIAGEYELMLGSRFCGLDPRDGGMPTYKFVMNRLLTWSQNRLMGTSLSEFHTGYRVFSSAALARIPYHLNRDDFVFDAEMLAQAICLGHRIGEVPSPARYFAGASSIGFRESVRYGFGVVDTTLRAWATRRGALDDERFKTR